MKNLNDLQHELQQAYAAGYIRYLYSTMYPDPHTETDEIVKIRKITVIFKSEIKVATMDKICEHIKTQYSNLVSGVYRDPMSCDNKVYIQISEY
jgi:hypothetical protein